MRLSRTLSYIREIQTLLNAPIVECKWYIICIRELLTCNIADNSRSNQTRHTSVGAIRESRELLRQEDNHAGQVGLVVEELADLMILLTPWLREMGQSLRTEDNGRTSSQQLAHVLRTARVVQILSLIHHFLGSVLSTAETDDQPSTTNIPETWSPIQRQSPPPPPKRKHQDHDGSSSSSSSKKLRE